MEKISAAWDNLFYGSTPCHSIRIRLENKYIKSSSAEVHNKVPIKTSLKSEIFCRCLTQISSDRVSCVTRQISAEKFRFSRKEVISRQMMMEILMSSCRAPKSDTIHSSFNWDQEVELLGNPIPDPWPRGLIRNVNKRLFADHLSFIYWQILMGLAFGLTCHPRGGLYLAR